MHYDNPFFDAAVKRTADRLMRSYTEWRDETTLLIQMGEESDFFLPVDDLDEMKHAFHAIAERLVLEDLYSSWEWVSTAWMGIDGNTGRSAYIIDFVSGDYTFPEWAVLSFYVTHGRLWFATPLTEVDDPRHGLPCSEANSVRQAIRMCDQSRRR